ncbi:MAG: DUF6273 domain-containing protein [bacterium]|nr:DUF6273 domain-containing protein [bacterium]
MRLEYGQYGGADASGDNAANGRDIPYSRGDGDQLHNAMRCFSCLAAVIVLTLVIAAIYIYYIEPARSYKEASALMERGDFAQAELVFNKLGDYKDSEIKASSAKLQALLELLKKSQFDEAIKYFHSLTSKDWRNTADRPDLQNEIRFEVADYLFRQKKYNEALNYYLNLGDYRDSRERAQACVFRMGGEAYFADQKYDFGSIMEMGRFEQDNNTANGAEPIEWIVVRKAIADDGLHILLISRYCLDCRPYQDKKPFTEWKDSSLRKWLNHEFYGKAFNNDEHGKIVTVKVGPDWCDFFREVENGHLSADNVFILSEEEMNICLFNGGGRKGLPTPFAVSRGVQVKEDGSCRYWLRNKTVMTQTSLNKLRKGKKEYALLKKAAGYIVDEPAFTSGWDRGCGLEADAPIVGVRPAMHIIIKSAPRFIADNAGVKMK